MTQQPRLGPAYQAILARGIVLPPVRPAVANYRKWTLHDGLLHLSGHGPVASSGELRTGKVGSDVSAEAAYDHARLTGLNLLATLEDAIGSLDRVIGLIRLFGMVNATPDFAAHSRVIDGCSDLMVEVFGSEIGGHARSAIGVSSLPGRITVEVELVAKIR